MNEVVGRVDASQRCIQRGNVKNITTNDVREFVDQSSQFVRRSGQTPQDDRLAFEQWDQPTTDVPGSAGQ